MANFLYVDNSHDRNVQNKEEKIDTDIVANLMEDGLLLVNPKTY